MAGKDGGKRKAADEATDRLRSAILRGEYRPGTDLPGERELSATLGVSRLTLRSALARLEAEGLVRPIHGSGNRVLDLREHGTIDLIGHLVAHADELSESTPMLAQLLEVRRFAAVEAIGVATERATDEDILALKANIELQASLIDKPDEYIHADLRFARLLTRATHNTAFILLSNSIVRIIESAPGITVSFFLDPKGTLVIYRKFVQLIEARDPQYARALANRLIAKFDRGLVDRLIRIKKAFEEAKEP